MNLQPVDAVQQFAVRHREALSAIHRELTDVVPAAFAMLEPLHPNGRIHGGVLSAVVRDAFLVRLGAAEMRMGELRATECQFRSVRFHDPDAQQCRVHMHPKNLKTGNFLATTTLADPLFGPSDVEFEIAVLWRPSPLSKSLRSASLAAVENLGDRNLTTIYASAPLPPIDMDAYWEPTVSEAHHEPSDDFDEFLAGEEFGSHEFD